MDKQELDRAVRAAASELQDAIVLKCGDLADRILGRPELGTDAWLKERAEQDTPTGQQWLQEWHLTKARIYTGAGLDPLGDVINARKAGATWDAIGDACGVSGPSAQFRWAKYTTHLGNDEPMPVRPNLDGLDGEDLG